MDDEQIDFIQLFIIFAAVQNLSTIWRWRRESTNARVKIVCHGTDEWKLQYPISNPTTLLYCLAWALHWTTWRCWQNGNIKEVQPNKHTPLLCKSSERSLERVFNEIFVLHASCEENPLLTRKISWLRKISSFSMSICKHSRSQQNTFPYQQKR